MHCAWLVQGVPGMRCVPVPPHTRSVLPLLVLLVEVPEQQLAAHCVASPHEAPSTWQRVISRTLPVMSFTALPAPLFAKQVVDWLPVTARLSLPSAPTARLHFAGDEALQLLS